MEAISTRTIHEAVGAVIPAWITAHPTYRGWRPKTMPATLELIAGACIQVMPDGSLIGAMLSSDELAQLAGCRRSTVCDHLGKLREAGFLASVGRGPNNVNIWAIPGAPGALAGRSLPPLFDRMAPTFDGRRTPQRPDPRPGQQRPLFAQAPAPTIGPDPLPQQPTGADRCPEMDVKVSGFRTPEPVGCPETGRPETGHHPDFQPKNGGGVRKPDTHHKYHGYKNHGFKTMVARAGVDGGGRAGKPGARGVPHVELEDLRDTDRLLRLFDELVRRSIVKACDADRLRVFGAAEHALRIGGKPAAMFAATVRRGEWLYITQDDENRARLRLRDHLDQADAQPAPSPRKLSAPAEALARAMGVTDRSLTHEQAVAAAARSLRWDQATLDRALAELNHHRSPP